MIISFVWAPISVSWSHASLCQAQIQDSLMGPGSQSSSVTLPTSRAGKGHPRDWLNLAFLPAAGETNQADAGSGGAPQGYPAVLLPWCQGLAPCVWVQQVSAPELLCMMEWCCSDAAVMLEHGRSSHSLADAQLRTQQFESWPLCDQAAVFNFSLC